MVVIQNFSQLQEMVRERVREIMVIGELTAKIQKASTEPTELGSNAVHYNNIRALISTYDIVGYKNRGSDKGVILRRKVTASL